MDANNRANNRANTPTNTSPLAKGANDRAFYESWKTMLDWLRDYAARHEGVFYKMEADFPDYIYRMERPYDLPTITMTASLTKADGHPVLMVSASPRHAVFKEIVLHPFDSHVYRTLKWSPEKGALVEEGRRPFTEEMFVGLAGELFGIGMVEGAKGAKAE